MTLSLDCESCDSTLDSLAKVFCCDRGQLEDALRSLDLSSIYSDLNESPDIPSDEYLYKHIVDKFGEPCATDSVCWFHLTRTVKENDFSDGILPLTEVLDSIWSMLFEIFDNSEASANLKRLKEEGVPDFQYSLKSEDDFHAGPYAILVRDVAFNASRLAQHDYLSMPEIIEDICHGYKVKYGTSIYEEVENALCPCIVKFEVYEPADQAQLEAALYYAYTCANELPVEWGAVYGFDAENTVIEEDCILEVEFLSDNE